MMQILAVVPPMSKERMWSMPKRSAIQADRMAPPAGPDSTSRTGKAHRRLERGQAAAGRHQQHRAAEARRRECGCEPARDSAPSAAAHRHWRRWSRSARTRGSRGRPRRTARCGTPGSAAARISRRPPLVRRIGVAVQEADGDALDALRLQGIGSAVTAASSSASRTPPLASTRSGTVKRKVRGTSGSRLLDEDVVLLEAVLLRHLDRSRGSPWW